MLKKIKHIRQRIREGRLKELIIQLKWLGIYVRRYWILITFYTVLMSSGSVLGLGTTMVSKELIDAVTGYNSRKIASVAVAYVGIGVGQIFINIIRMRISLKIRLKISNEIRADIFEQVLWTDWEAVSEFRTGDLLYRINGDAAMLANHVLTFIPNVVSVLISFVGAFVIMLENDPVMAMIALAGAPVSLISSRFTTTKLREYTKKTQDFSSNKMVFDQETFQNLQLVKAFGLVPNFIQRFHHIQEESAEISLEQNKFQSLTMMVTSFVGQLVGYACYGFAVYRLWQGDISYGTMTMYLGMSGSLRGSFSSVIGLVPTLIRACINVERIIEVTNLPRENVEDNEPAMKIKTKARETGVEIRMENVGFWYEEGVTVYRNVNITARPGEIVGIIGPSGGGKTTTLNLLLGLFHPKEGEIYIGNPEGEKLQVSSATRCLFGYIPQGNTMFSGTILENMRMVREDAGVEEVIQALKAACAWEFVKKLEEGLDTQVKELGRRFSEGQKQRLSIARALLADAPVLLLDEATSALDVATESQVLKNIMKKEPRRTVIVAAHRPSVFSMCSRVYKIQKGEVHEVDESSIREFLEMEKE